MNRSRVVTATLIVLAIIVAVVVAECDSSGGSPSASHTGTGTRSVSDGEATSLPGFPAATSRPPTQTANSLTADQRFITAVFNDIQDEWAATFKKAGKQYHQARLVLFSSAVKTGCGTETSDVGPFYCPADQTVYLDLQFFKDMEKRYGVKGDFSQAYVVAHEVGHHIQLLTGVTTQVHTLSQQRPAQANALSIRTELQADCYAGVWAHSAYTRNLLEPGDLDEALTAAAAVGDDFLQKQATGSVQPESWTHGTSAQRQKWLQTGYDKGEPSACNTFAAASP